MAKPSFTKGGFKGKSMASLLKTGPIADQNTVGPTSPAPVQKGIARGIAAMKSKMKGR